MGQARPTDEMIREKRERFLNDPSIKYYTDAIMRLHEVAPIEMIIRDSGESEIRTKEPWRSRIQEIERMRDDYIKATYGIGQHRI